MDERLTFTKIDPEHIGRIKYGATLETFALGKPFIALRVLEGTVYDEDGQCNHKAKIRLYVDPRGESEFAIGVHPWMEKLLGSGSARRSWAKTEFGIKFDSSGQYYILAPTAKEVKKAFYDLQLRYIERLRVINGKEYLGVFFQCEAPVFDASGAELPPDETINTGGTRRRNSSKVRMELDVAHGVKIENDRFFEISADGSINSHWRSDDTQAVFLEYTPENIERVNVIRHTLARAADMLSDLFDKPPEDFLAQIAGSTIALPAPRAPAAPVKTYAPEVAEGRNGQKRIRRVRK